MSSLEIIHEVHPIKSLVLTIQILLFLPISTYQNTLCLVQELNRRKILNGAQNYLDSDLDSDLDRGSLSRVNSRSRLQSG